METKKRGYGLYIFIGIIILIFAPIIADYISKQNIETLNNNLINEKITSKESFILYNGKLTSSNKKELLSLKNNNTNKTSVNYGVYNTNSNKLEDVVYLYIEGDLQKSYSDYNIEELSNDVETFILGNNIDENKSYKVADSFNEYKKIVNGEKTVMTVFGRNSCSWCNKFKPVYNAVAAKYDIDIYYFDSDSYNENEYKKVLNMNLVIPSKCGSDGSEFKLIDGFGTPLTIFTKNGNVIDCISGYVNRSSLIEKLKVNNMISE